MPNSGSDWLASCIASSQDLRYFREFFNPVTNDKHAAILELEFGSEQITNFDRIATFDIKKCQEVFDLTWTQHDFNFTKENYSGFKIDFFRQKFECICLIRNLRSIFPPSRPEVLTWYDAIYHSLRLSVNLSDEQHDIIKKSNRDNVRSRVTAAYTAYKKRITEDCKKYDIPIIKHEELLSFDEDNLIHLDAIKKLPDPKKLAREIISSRKKTSKSTWVEIL